MSIDLNTLSARELETLITQAKKRKTVLKKRKPITTVRARLKAAAAAEGYTIAELFGGGASSAGTEPRATKAPRAPRKTTGIKVAPKYRNPANAEQTWTGRGKQPRWMAEEVSKGKKPEDFLIA
ncbi:MULTISPECIES: H-NS histone family protein [unclassified Luteimonas]|uniref:H-NS histone family protein n=1 Tax=unclassified Luteimonas TaxID=2629088 RepID=UPI0018F0B826|nr:MULTISPECIES: H-NS histone family protein [unclassified Luteimonas]MBJ6978575.1 H-NS histone family protein [Luteimonas sp. MC1895]MBJ6983472.1 H-NS histone family protein [Luteimonas sp. MC1750]QQO06323.1 H-NS histone family protein [Luteimonas sp. MC1750]